MAKTLADTSAEKAAKDRAQRRLDEIFVLACERLRPEFQPLRALTLEILGPAFTTGADLVKQEDGTIGFPESVDPGHQAATREGILLSAAGSSFRGQSSTKGTGTGTDGESMNGAANSTDGQGSGL